MYLVHYIPYEKLSLSHPEIIMLYLTYTNNDNYNDNYNDMRLIDKACNLHIFNRSGADDL